MTQVKSDDIKLDLRRRTSTDGGRMYGHRHLQEGGQNALPVRVAREITAVFNQIGGLIKKPNFLNQVFSQ